MILAETLVSELMLVSVLVAGEGADALAEALTHAGAAAEVLSGSPPTTGFDLAILLAPADAAHSPETRALVDVLSRASDRLLLAPLPLGQPASGTAPALPELPHWFELFAELGYQPVVEFDAGFVSAGAFLVDRAATAAEGDLAAFTDRLQMGTDAAAQQREVVQEANTSVRAELLSAKAELAAAETALRAAQNELARCQADLTEADSRASALAAQAQQDSAALHDMARHNAGWDALRAWVRLDVMSLSRNTRAVLARDLPALNALRAPDLPPVTLPPVEKSTWLGRLSRRPIRSATHAALEDAARVRASEQFDAAWYVASHPADFSAKPLDPALHYVLVGGPRGADPGPHFDTASYLAAHPDAAGCPLAHALRARTA
jgi:hypothetical protein